MSNRWATNKSNRVLRQSDERNVWRGLQIYEYSQHIIMKPFKKYIKMQQNDIIMRIVNLFTVNMSPERFFVLASACEISLYKVQMVAKASDSKRMIA